MDGSVFGAGRSQAMGQSFDIVEFLKRPATIIRLVSLFFALIVFSCISSGGYVEDKCIMHGDNGSCGFGIFVGVLAFFACILFLVMDVLINRLTSMEHRKYATMVDLGFSGVWTFFYFVSFCYMTNKLSTTPQKYIDTEDIAGWQVSNVRAAIAFSFFSIVSFAATTFFAFQRYRNGFDGAFESSDYIESQAAAGGSGGSGAGYPGFGSQPQGGGYQQQPFGSSAAAGDLSSGGQQQQQYQPPAY